MRQRTSGLLLHPTSLPGGSFNGELGRDAFRFVDFLHDSGQSIWQTLPLGPTHDDLSPYQSSSAHAGSPMLISGERLLEQKLINDGDLQQERLGVQDPFAARQNLIELAYKQFESIADQSWQASFATFIKEQAYWLEDYALYIALKHQFKDASWIEWPAPLRDRDPAALKEARQKYKQDVAVTCFGQYLFFSQWLDLKRYANERSIIMFGDMPIFVSHDSADVWANSSLFLLDENKNTTFVAGVPPDYFSETGQRWGNPLYNWDALKATKYAWWKQRFHTQIKLFDLIRIDHFRGFEAYWVIPSHEKTAMNGYWAPGPRDDFFVALQEEFGERLPLVAEDLGFITEDVHQLRLRYFLPGMKILQFAFDGSASNPYLPHHHELNSVVYSGTHDNNTILGWYNALAPDMRARVYAYFGNPSEAMPWMLIRQSLASVANTAIIPMQDILGIAEEGRMNMPGTTEHNWRWRFTWSQIDTTLAEFVRNLTRAYDRI